MALKASLQSHGFIRRRAEGTTKMPHNWCMGKGQTMAKEEINEKTACMTKHESYTEKVVIWIIASPVIPLTAERAKGFVPSNSLWIYEQGDE